MRATEGVNPKGLGLHPSGGAPCSVFVQIFALILLGALMALLAAAALVVTAALFLFVFAYQLLVKHRSMGVGYCAVQSACLIFSKLFYRIRAQGLEHLPVTGGALIVCNHVSYMDAVIVGILFRRPVRFLSWEGFERVPVMRMITRMMGTVPVSEEKAKDAIQRAADALARGEVVCIFPEGSLTRTGGVLPLRRGYELIARRAGVPIVPMVIDGLWGSIFSHSGGKFFWKLPRHFPRPLHVVVGAPFPAAEHATTRLRLLELAGQAFARHETLDRHLGREVVHGLVRKAGRVALVDRTVGRREFSGATLLALGWVMARRLRRLTAARRVGIILPPGIGATVANLACLFAGKVPVNLNYTLGREQGASCLRRAEVDLIITAEAFRTKLLEKFPDFPWGDRRLDIAEELKGLRKTDVLPTFLAARVLPAWALAALLGLPRRGGDEEAALLFTSGSSGEPKGVQLSHRNLLANLRQIEDADILPEQAVLLSSLPVFHSFGFTVGLWYPLTRPIGLVTLPSPLDTAGAVKAVREEQVTVLVGTPTFLRPYLRRATAEDFASLRFAVVGAEKCPEDLTVGFREQLGVTLLEGYGITETSPVLSVNVPDRVDPEAPGGVWTGGLRGSVGRPVRGIAVRFKDPETGAELPAGEVGLLEVRGPNVFLGYLGDSARTAEAKGDGWYRTGDLARMDVDGFLHLAGRLSRFSKIGGEMVPHGTVEEALLKVLDLAGATELKLAVSSAADPTKGEQLVVLHVDDLDVEATRTALATAGLANLWIPKVFKKVPGIPILGTGKLDLNRLRQMAQG